MQLAARTWTNAGLLHSHKKESQEAADCFARALTFRISSRDLEALASAHANLALAMLDLGHLDTALENANAGHDIGLNALCLGPVHTLSDHDIPKTSDAQQLLKAVATCLLTMGSVQERMGRDCLTSYQSAMLIARHLVAGSECLAEKIQQKYASVLQLELERACCTRDQTYFHSRMFRTSERTKRVSSASLQHELAAGRTGKVSRKFLLGADVEFEAASKMQHGGLMQSRHLRNLAFACAMTLQCALRSHLARQRYSQRRKLFPLQTGPAVRVQCVFRGHLGRRHFSNRLHRSRKTSVLCLQAFVQRRLQHDRLIRHLTTRADALLPVGSLARPGSTIPRVGSAVRARQLMAAAGLDHDHVEQTLACCCDVLRDQGCQPDDIDTFALLLDRDDQMPVLAEQFFWAILEVLLLRADASDVEDVREACSVFDLVVASNNPASWPAAISLSSFLLTLGYSDSEVDMVLTTLEQDAVHHFPSATAQGSRVHHHQGGTHSGDAHGRLVSRQAFVPAMAAMLSCARQARADKQKRRRARSNIAQFEPQHPLLRIMRKNSSVRLQCAWRAKMSRWRLFNSSAPSICSSRYCMQPEICFIFVTGSQVDSNMCLHVQAVSSNGKKSLGIWPRAARLS